METVHLDDDKVDNGHESKSTICRLCLSLSPSCISIYSDTITIIVTCLPVTVTRSDEMSLPPWVCQTCVDYMRMCWQFFTQVCKSYDSITGGKLDNYLKYQFDTLDHVEIKTEIQVPDEKPLPTEFLQEEHKLQQSDSQDTVDNNRHFLSDSDNSDSDFDPESDKVAKSKVKSIGEDARAVKILLKSSKKTKRGPTKGVARGPYNKKPKSDIKDAKIPVLKNIKARNLKLKQLASMCTCTECGQQFSHNKILVEHWLDQHPGKPTQYQCCEEMEDCSYSTGNDVAMQDHLKQHLTELGLFQICDLCPGTKYYRKRGMSEHIKNVHGEKTHKCEVCFKLFKTEYYLKLHEKSHSEVKVKHFCDICGREFSSSSGLQMHMDKHSGKKPFKCPDCDLWFSNRIELRTHSVVHTDERPFMCDQCDASYKISRQLKDHINQVHLGIHKYQCKYCPKQYSKMELFKNHMSSHTGEMPFKCSTCGKGFGRKDKLRRHEILHESDEVKYKYPCEYCGKRFTQNNNLKTHIKSHHSSLIA